MTDYSHRPGPCIWPDCRRTTGLTSAHLCSLHVAQVIADHTREVERIEREHREDQASWQAQEDARLGHRARRSTRKPSPAAHVAIRPYVPPPERPGWVYYLRIGGHYKIGWAKRLNERLKAYPPDGQVLAVHEGSRSDEAALHRRFAHLTSAGREWYPLVPDITRHIELMTGEYGQPDPALHCGPKPTEVRRPNLGRNGPSPRYWTGKRTA